MCEIKVVVSSQNVTYIYSASGAKLATNANGSLTYYRSVMVYNGDNSLAYLIHPEGTVTCTNGAYTYNYFKKDQVGSTRVMLSAVGGTLQPQQTTDYYPFGLAHAANNLNKNKLLFSGKELQDSGAETSGGTLSMYDFGARQYDALVGRWLRIDPLARKYIGLSPYSYCANNPVNFTDPTGMKIDTLSESDFASILGSLQNDLMSAQNRLNALNATDHEWQSSGIQGTMDALGMQIASIGFTLNTMSIMQTSSQLYSLNKIGSNESGGLRLDVTSGRNAIVISYGAIPNFVHEAVHVWQFEQGRFGFSRESGKPMLNDIYKEVEAYRVQYDYNPNSVKGLWSSAGSIASKAGITTTWVQGLYDNDWKQPYARGEYAKVGIVPLDVNSTIGDLRRAYPDDPVYRQFDPNEKIQQLPSLYYKTQPVK